MKFEKGNVIENIHDPKISGVIVSHIDTASGEGYAVIWADKPWSGVHTREFIEGQYRLVLE